MSRFGPALAVTVAAIAFIPALAPSTKADLQLPRIQYLRSAIELRQSAVPPHALAVLVAMGDETLEPHPETSIAQASSRMRTASAIGAPGSCPRPVDQYGTRYQSLTGAYQSRGETPGGGKYLTLLPDRAAAPMSIMVTAGAFDAARTLRAGARITVVAYMRSSMSGVQPPFSCIDRRLRWASGAAAPTGRCQSRNRGCHKRKRRRRSLDPRPHGRPRRARR
jgi:hypothetical protein